LAPAPNCARCRRLLASSVPSIAIADHARRTSGLGPITASVASAPIVSASIESTAIDGPSAGASV
jgi:hypothetical protein